MKGILDNMSYVNRKTLEDFDEAYRYGVKLTTEEIKQFDKLIKKIEKELSNDTVVIERLKEMLEYMS